MNNLKTVVKGESVDNVCNSCTKRDECVIELQLGAAIHDLKRVPFETSLVFKCKYFVRDELATTKAQRDYYKKKYEDLKAYCNACYGRKIVNIMEGII